MSRFLCSRNRIARRFGANIFSRQKNPLSHRPNPPGMHGSKKRKKSDYGKQLEEKQKLKAAFGMISESQLIKYFRLAVCLSKRKGGSPASNLMQQLECRLDNIVFRLKFASTPFAAQQLVSHRHVLVDGKVVNIRSFQVRPGMEISLKTTMQKDIVKLSMGDKRKVVPEYLELDINQFKGKLISMPDQEQIVLPININVSTVCEFLAHNH